MNLRSHKHLTIKPEAWSEDRGGVLVEHDRGLGPEGRSKRRVQKTVRERGE